MVASSENFEAIFGLKRNGGVMKEKHNRDLTNLDLGAGFWRCGVWVGGRMFAVCSTILGGSMVQLRCGRRGYDN